MPVNGLLVTLTSDYRRAEAVRTVLSSRSEVLLSPAYDRWQPLAVDMPDVKSAHDFHEWLEALPGVEQVDVIYVGFDQPTPQNTAL